jgi:hypothetical protein
LDVRPGTNPNQSGFTATFQLNIDHFQKYISQHYRRQRSFDFPQENFLNIAFDKESIEEIDWRKNLVVTMAHHYFASDR